LFDLLLIKSPLVMKTAGALSPSALKTYAAITGAPLPLDLPWSEVRTLFRALCPAEELADGGLRVTRNAQTLVLHLPLATEVAEPGQIEELREFLVRSAKPIRPLAGPQLDWLAVIDHHEARVFRSGTRGTGAEVIRPPDSDEYFRHEHNSKNFSRGKERPDPNTFFGPVADALKGAGRILVFGNGKGTSNEMDQFVAWLKRRRPELASRIAGTVVVDEYHLTTSQLLSLAHDYFSSHPAL
jgi:hypothetical protein